MLTLPIKREWFTAILEGRKKEEYREIKPYYSTRFRDLIINAPKRAEIKFRNGYSGNSPSFVATVTLSVGEGKAEWGATPGKEYYILHILQIHDVRSY